MKKKFCPHCGGRILRPAADFCPTCGHPLQSKSVQGPRTIRTGSDAPYLIVQAQGESPRTVYLSRFPAVLGRDPLQSDIVLPYAIVSGRHALIEELNSEFWITDLGSTNGTRLNARLLQKNISQKVWDGVVIRIGDPQGNSVGITFRSSNMPHASTIHLGRQNLANLSVIDIGRNPASQIHLPHPAVSWQHAQVQGTAQGHTIRDSSSANGTFLNGHPLKTAQSLQSGDVIQIGPYKLVYDSTGFTQFSVSGNYRLDGIALRREVSVVSLLSPRRWLNPGKATLGKVILRDVSLSVHPKEFIALVGGSGAGKSTLLKALSGFTPAEGQVLVNGDDLYTHFGIYRTILGYVPQDDIIHLRLTVEGALRYSARLRLPDANDQEIKQRIDVVLSQVEMNEHRSKLIHQLSGGQRKRVSIAVELLAEPGLFFLDEPTSGLDPGLEKKMMFTLRQLADSGRTIVLVTHATANIDQCDHVAFMADGFLSYFGPPHEALNFFGVQDFADIYTELSNTLDPSKHSLPPDLLVHFQQLQVRSSGKQVSAAEVWTRCYQSSQHYRRYVADRLSASAKNPPSSPSARQTGTQKTQSLKQFVVLTQRYFELIHRDTVSLFILLAVMPIIGLLLLIMAESHDLTGQSLIDIKHDIQESIVEQREDQDPSLADEQFQATYQVAGAAQRLLFMLALAANLLGIFAASFEIIGEAAVYRRERMVNLNIIPYLLSKVTVLGMFALLQSVLLLIVIHLKVEYPDEGILLHSFPEMSITLFLATLTSICLGLLISALVRSRSTVIYVILLVLFIQILFAGAIFELPNAAKPISYLTTTRWTLEALGSTVDMDGLASSGVTCIESENEQHRRMMGMPDAPCEEGQQKLTPIYHFNVKYDHAGSHLISRWCILVGFALSFLSLTYLVQRRKDTM